MNIFIMSNILYANIHWIFNYICEFYCEFDCNMQFTNMRTSTSSWTTWLISDNLSTLSIETIELENPVNAITSLLLNECWCTMCVAHEIIDLLILMNIIKHCFNMMKFVGVKFDTIRIIQQKM